MHSFSQTKNKSFYYPSSTITKKCIQGEVLFKKYNLNNVTSASDIILISNIVSDIISSLYFGATIGCYFPESTWFTETLIEKLENKNKITALEAIQSLMDELDLAIEQPHDFSMRTNQIKFKRVIINKSLLKI
jgi:hypothetical protein